MKKTPAKKILPKSHTGKLRHHKHTSYSALALVLVLATMPLFYASKSVAFAATSGGGSSSTYAVVPGPIPSSAPTISNLSSGTIFTTSDPVSIKGSCPGNTLVKIFKNEVLAGAALCQNGSYQLQIDLFIGNNSLIARAYNTNDVASPDSSVVSAQLRPAGSDLNSSDQLNSQGAPAGQFYMTSQVFHRGAEVGDTMTWPLTLAGGQPPYAVSVSWGDGKTELISPGNANTLDIKHVYSQTAGASGSFTVVIHATDQAGNNSYLQLVAIVSGSNKPAGVVGNISGGYKNSAVVRTAWQAIVVLAIIVLSFWLGERRELKILKSRIRQTA